jgi:hypothetical protein
VKPYYRKTIRGSASALENELNRLLDAGALHEVWNLGVTANPDDIELNLELNRVLSPPAGTSTMRYMVVSTYSMRIDAIENDLRNQNKYITTAHRAPLHNDKERSVAIITLAR